MKTYKIDARRLTDDAALHDVMKETFNFPDHYGRNLNALVDVLTDLDEPVILVLNYADIFVRRQPELWQQLQDTLAFVNWRRVEANEAAVICLAYHRH